MYYIILDSRHESQMKAERIRLSEESSFDRLSVGAVVGSSWSLRCDKLLNAERTRLYERMAKARNGNSGVRNC